VLAGVAGFAVGVATEAPMEGNPTDDVAGTLAFDWTPVVLVVEDAATVSTGFSFLTTHAARKHTSSAANLFIWRSCREPLAAG